MAIVTFLFGFFLGFIIVNIWLYESTKNKKPKISQNGIFSDETKITKISDFNTGVVHTIYAECLNFADTVVAKPISGKYGGVIHLMRDRAELTCLNCKTTHDISFAHGDAYKCHCGCKYQRYGNALYVW